MLAGLSPRAAIVASRRTSSLNLGHDTRGHGTLNTSLQLHQKRLISAFMGALLFSAYLLHPLCAVGQKIKVGDVFPHEISVPPSHDIIDEHRVDARVVWGDVIQCSGGW